MKHRIALLLAVLLLPLFLPAPAFAGCTGPPTGNAGDIINNAAYNVLQYCDGTNWIAMGPHGAGGASCVPAAAVGTVMPDGSVYAGLSPDGSVPMDTTVCDAGQYWNGSACTACGSGLWSGSGSACNTTWSSTNHPTWNNGTANWTVTSYTSTTTGQANTAGLAALGDAGSPYKAASYCKNLSAYGHADWYLPAKDELSVMYGNRVAIANFDTTDGNTASGGAYPGEYWPSTEYSNSSAWHEDFSNGLHPNDPKASSYSARCVRKDTANPEGTLMYNNDYHLYQFCDGANWQPMGPQGAGGGGLVGWWKFDETSGTSAADSSGRGNTGTIAGAPTWTVGGKINGALSFNAADPDQVSTLTKYYFDGGSFTYAAWVNTTQQVSQVRIMGSMAASDGYVWLNESEGTTTGFSIELNTMTPADYQLRSSNVNISDGLWHHVALVVDRTANTISVYVDGAVKSNTSHTFVGNFGISGDQMTHHIGYQNASLAYTGLIDDARVYNRALSANEIAALYNLTSNEGDMFYDSDHAVMQYFNGASWVGIGK
jgi:hypothetical protein